MQYSRPYDDAGYTVVVDNICS